MNEKTSFARSIVSNNLIAESCCNQISISRYRVFWDTNRECFRGTSNMIYISWRCKMCFRYFKIDSQFTKLIPDFLFIITRQMRAIVAITRNFVLAWVTQQLGGIACPSFLVLNLPRVEAYYVVFCNLQNAKWTDRKKLEKLKMRRKIK